MTEPRTHYIDLDSDSSLHVAQFPSDHEYAQPMVAIHGAIENGRIFYPRNGSSWAREMAGKGFSVYVVDLRGRGSSKPSLERGSRFTQTDIIVDDLPKIAQWIQKRHPGAKQLWVTHSWGGVLVNAFLLRFPSFIESISAVVHFGAKRSVRVWNLHRIWMIDFGWRFMASLATGIFGYLPARRLGMGSDGESAMTHEQSVEWVYSERWTDSIDGFDYDHAASHVKLPKSLYISAEKDYCLGHRNDVRRFAEECGAHEHSFMHLSKKDGFRHDYNHISMLTHKEASEDHFPKILDWIRLQ